MVLSVLYQYKKIEKVIILAKVRTRFAPSPTGYMHVGNLRTALYAYLQAKQSDGAFILRIEDTDQERLVEGAVDIIYNTLKETGLIWDEGPDIGGEYGPYIQSERKDSYSVYANELVEKGGAYKCFCTKERIDEMREIQKASGQPPKYDGRCRELSKEEIDKNIAEGKSYVIRQKMPLSGDITFHDEVFGDITAPADTLDDQVLIKADGMPTYNFANVIDDHLMGITDVIRGNEYLSSTPKYNLLYEAFGWDVPKYIHCSPVMKDAQNKLSKRNGDASYQDLVEKGYLKEAILNYIALLGWSPGGEREMFTLGELVEHFSVKNISKSPAIFDINKLNFLNGEYIRALSEEQFYEKATVHIDKVVSRTIDKKLLCTVLQKRCEKLIDIEEQVDFFEAMSEYETELYTNKKMKTSAESSLSMLREMLPLFVECDDFSFEKLHEKLMELAKTLEVKNGYLLYPLRVALSGKAFTPGGGIEIAAILGKEETISRIEKAIEKLS